MANLTLNFDVKKYQKINLYVLSIRFLEFFFAGLIMGLCCYHIQTARAFHRRVLGGIIFLLILSIFSILTLFAYCFNIFRKLLWLFWWDFALFLVWIIAYFWFWDVVSPLTCHRRNANPFAGNSCQRNQSILIFSVVEGCLWLLTALIGLYELYKAYKAEKQAAAQFSAAASEPGPEMSLVTPVTYYPPQTHSHNRPISQTMSISTSGPGDTYISRTTTDARSNFSGDTKRNSISPSRHHSLSEPRKSFISDSKHSHYDSRAPSEYTEQTYTHHSHISPEKHTLLSKPSKSRKSSHSHRSSSNHHRSSSSGGRTNSRTHSRSHRTEDDEEKVRRNLNNSNSSTTTSGDSEQTAFLANQSSPPKSKR